MTQPGQAELANRIERLQKRVDQLEYLFEELSNRQRGYTLDRYSEPRKYFPED